MTQSWNTKPIEESVFYGYDDTHPLELLPKGFFTKADNVFVTDDKITKVFGSSTIAASILAQPFNGFDSYENISSSTKYLVVNINGASNAQLYSWNGSGNFTGIGSANLTNSKMMDFEVANNILFGFNGIEEVDWDGTTYTKNRSGVPLGKFAKWFHNYLFVSNTSSQPNRLFWSDLGDPKTFTGANFVDVNPGDSDQINCMALIQDELLIFKRNTIWAITGFSGTTFSATTIATQNTNSRIFGYGTMSPYSVVPVGNDVYYFSMLGSTPVIRSFYKTINSITLSGGIISDNIKATLDNITKANLSNIVGTFDGRYCYWGIPTAGSATNNQVIALDTWKINKKKNIYPFTTMSGKNISFFANSTIPGFSTVYFTDASLTSGLVFKFDTSVSTDNGANIKMDAITRGMMYHPDRKSHWKYVYMKYNTGVASSVTINAKTDFVATFSKQGTLALAGNSPGLGPTGTFTLGVSVLGGAVTNSSRITLAQQVGKVMQLEFTETSANAVTLYEYSVYGRTKGLRNS